MSELYAGGLLSEGKLFKERHSGLVFVSLGFVSQSVILFQTESVADSRKQEVGLGVMFGRLAKRARHAGRGLGPGFAKHACQDGC